MSRSLVELIRDRKIPHVQLDGGLMTRTTEKVKHTSGPWTVRETDAAIQIRAELEFISVAEMSKQVIGDDGEAYQAAMADARLIAASPEMLRALEQLAECNLNEDNCASFEVANRRIRNIVLPAIRRAKGE